MTKIVWNNCLPSTWIITAWFLSATVSCWIRPVLSEDLAEEHDGKLYICEECAPHWGREQHVRVSGVSLLCESDEDGEYTESQTCRPGDSASIAIDFTIRRMTGNFDVQVDMDSTWLGHWQHFQGRKSICKFDNLMFWGDEENDASSSSSSSSSTGNDDLYAGAVATTGCPLQNGPYTLITSFVIPDYTKSGIDFAFTPDLRVRFFKGDKDGYSRELIGCVETGTLAKVSFNRGMQRKGELFFVMSVFGLCLVLALCLLAHQRKRKQGERTKRKQKASMMRRFHYIRTNHSGDMAIDPARSISGSFSYGETTTPGTPPESPYRQVT